MEQYQNQPTKHTKSTNLRHDQQTNHTTNKTPNQPAY